MTDVLTTDDRLDALALVRCYLRGDTQAMKVMLDAAGSGMYLALLHLTGALTIAQSNGNPEAYLKDLAASVRGDHEEGNTND